MTPQDVAAWALIALGIAAIGALAWLVWPRRKPGVEVHPITHARPGQPNTKREGEGVQEPW